MGKLNMRSAPLVGVAYGTVFELRKRDLVPVAGSLEFDVAAAVADDARLNDADNRELVDDNTAQSLTTEQIAELKKSGSGADVVSALMASSATFKGKTAFSQAKYLRQKARKYIKRFQVLRPTLRIVCDAMFAKGPSKIWCVCTHHIAR